MMVATFVFAIIIANWRIVLAFTSGFFWPTTLAIVIAAFDTGWKAAEMPLYREGESSTNCSVNIVH
jgi:hypothetical protein